MYNIIMLRLVRCISCCAECLFIVYLPLCYGTCKLMLDPVCFAGEKSVCINFKGQNRLFALMAICSTHI